jgi:hypothetical protein
MMIVKKMKAANIAKGIGIGMAIGGAVGLAGGAMTHPEYQRTMKKGLNKALKTFGNVLDAIG